jgi:predicted RNA binding protein YcfA (HicA-like mRNA interferase family)
VPTFGPISRHDLISCLKRLGFAGPYAGGKHQYLVRGHTRLFIPNPHTGEIGRELLARILRQAGVDRKDWDTL